MEVTDTVSHVAEFIWDLLTDDRSVSKFQQDPHAVLASGGHDTITVDQFQQAMERIVDRLPPAQAAHVAPMLQAAQQLPVTPQHVASIAPQALHASVQPVHQVQPVQHVQAAPVQVVRNVTEQRVVHEHVTAQVTNNNTTNTTTNNSHQTFVREGDVVVDNRVTTEINAHGDVTLEQRVATTAVVAGKGAVAVGGDVSHSVVNTGRNEGVLAGGDVDIDDAIVGDGNTQVNDSTVGAFAGKGPATAITGTNVNTGRGDLTTVHAEGDAQVVHGNGNEVTGAVDIDIDDVNGPTNIAMGDGNRQQGVQDNHTTVSDSGNTDNSVQDSANTHVVDSGNQTTVDDDTTVTSVEDSHNSELSDDDLTTVHASADLLDTSSFTHDDAGMLDSSSLKGSSDGSFLDSQDDASLLGDHDGFDAHLAPGFDGHDDGGADFDDLDGQ